MTMQRWTPEEEAALKKFVNQPLSGVAIYHKLANMGVKRTYKAVLKKLEVSGWVDPVDLKRMDLFKGPDGAIRPPRIGYLDIEADALDAMFGTVLTWCIKERGNPKIKYDVIKRSELLSFKYDKRILTSLSEELKKYDKVYTYYGGDRRYDFPMVRSRCLQQGIDFPKWGQLSCVDLYVTAKNKLRLRGYSLKNVTKFFGIKGKTELEPEMWRRAKFGDKKALDYVLTHNKFDVIILEKLHDMLEDYTLDSGVSI